MKSGFWLILLFLLFFRFSLAQNWTQWGSGIFEPIQTVYADSTELYVAGRVLNSAGDTLRGVAKWNGTDWDSLGNADFNYAVTRILKFQDTLYVAGSFKKANGAPADMIVKWNGTRWDSLVPTPHSGEVSDMIVFNDQLWMIGMNLGEIGTTNLGSIESYDGQWHHPPNNIGIFPEFRKLQIYNGELFLGGKWESDSLSSIMKWNGSSWDALGSGLHSSVGTFDPVVLDIEQYKGELYVGGAFTKYTGHTPNPANYLVKWNGATWDSVGCGVGGTAYELQEFQNELYSPISVIGEIACEKIAKWDSTKWCCLPGQFNGGSISSLFAYSGELIASGGFTDVDGQQVKYLAKWIGGNQIDTCSTPISVTEIDPAEVLLQFYPNPSSGMIKVEYSFPQSQNGLILQVTDYIGKVLGTYRLKATIGSEFFALDLSNLPGGFYMGSIILEDSSRIITTRKIIKY